MLTPQAPIGSGFGAASTARDVIAGIDLTGKTAIVTGGSAGMGLEITRALLAAGAAVVVPARDLDKARRNLDGLAAELLPMDLMDAGSIDAFAAAFLPRHQRLDILIENAGTIR